MASLEKMLSSRWLIAAVLLLPILSFAQDQEESDLLENPYEQYEDYEIAPQDEDSEDEYYFDEEEYDDEEFEIEEPDYLINRERRAIQEDHGDVADYSESEVEQQGTTDWDKLTEGYDYAEADESFDGPEFDVDMPDVSAPDPIAWQYFLVALTVGVLVFVLFKLLQNQGASNVKVGNLEIELEEAERNIQETELEGLLRRSVDANDYRSALRVRYLMVLKELDALDWIYHRIDKTNWTYVMELGDRAERPAFQRLTNVFEYAWYGNIELTEQDDRLFAKDFGAFLRSIEPRDEG